MEARRGEGRHASAFSNPAGLLLHVHVPSFSPGTRADPDSSLALGEMDEDWLCLANCTTEMLGIASVSDVLPEDLVVGVHRGHPRLSTHTALSWTSRRKRTFGSTATQREQLSDTAIDSHC